MRPQIQSLVLQEKAKGDWGCPGMAPRLREMAQMFRILVAFPQEQVSVARAYTVAQS